MLAEMAHQTLTSLVSDFDRIRAAEQMKGVRSGIRSIVPARRVLVNSTLMRAEYAAKLLAVLRYVKGGTFVCAFTMELGDYVAVFLTCAYASSP